MLADSILLVVNYMENPVNEITPLEALNLVLRKWYLLVLLGIVGGMAGYGASILLPPQYEARAVLQVTLFLPEGTAYTDEQTDYILNSAIDVVFSKSLIEQFVVRFQDSGDLKFDDFSLERRESYWDFVVRSRDQELAAEAANAWLDESLARLEVAGAHSLLASQLASRIEILTGCKPDHTQLMCEGFSDQDELAGQGDDLWEQYQQEVKESRGLSPSLQWKVESRASLPIEPAIHSRGGLILAGMGIGFLLGYIVLQIPIRNQKKI